MSREAPELIPSTPVCIERAVDDVEVLFDGAEGEGWELEHVQLTSAPLGAWYRIVPLPNLTIHWYRCNAALHIREYHERDLVYLAIPLSADNPFRWRGIDLNADQALLYHPGQEHDYILPQNVHFMGISLSRHLLRRMGWNLDDEPLLQVDQRSIARLAVEAHRVTDAVLGGNVGGEGLEIMQERLALHLEKLLAPALGDTWTNPVTPSGSLRLYELASAARQQMLDDGLMKKLDIDQLTATMRTSTRTLYRAFRHCYGVGPYEYHTLLRFQAFRHMARMEGFRRGIVTDMALKYGFNHLGRFASAYRAHYGELPKDSIRRWLKE